MKKIKIAILAAGVLLLAGCGNKPADKTGEIGKENKNDIVAETNDDNGGIISSIKDAMGLGKAMKCEYKFKDANGEINSVAYIDGKKYKAESTVMGKNQIVVFDETAMYSWAESEKTGMKMTKTCMEEMANNLPEGGNASIPNVKTDEEYFDDATDVSCVPYSGADFSVPADIVFADQCEMLKNMLKNIPTGVNIPSGVNIPQLP